MPLYLVELNPLDLMAMDKGLTRDMINPNMLQRDIKHLESLLPGAKLRGIVLQSIELLELEHTSGLRGEDRKRLFGLPLMEFDEHCSG